MGLFSSPTLYFKKKKMKDVIFKLAFLQFLVRVLDIITMY